MQLSEDKLDQYKDFYDKEGYFHYKKVTSEFSDTCKTAAKITNKLLNSYDDGLKTWKSSDGKAKHLVNPHLKDKTFEEIATSEHLKKLINKFLDGKKYNLYCTHSKISIKEKSKKHEWLPHQDSSYKKTNLPGLTVAVLLDDCSKSNGALQIYPKSHLKGKIDHLRSEKGDNKNQTYVIDKTLEKPVDIVGKSGEVVIFNCNTVHGGGENIKGGIRSIYIFEVEPFISLAIDTLGNKPLIFSGNYSNLQFILSKIKFSISRFLKKIYSLFKN